MYVRQRREHREVELVLQHVADDLVVRREAAELGADLQRAPRRAKVVPCLLTV